MGMDRVRLRAGLSWVPLLIAVGVASTASAQRVDWGARVPGVGAALASDFGLDQPSASGSHGGMPVGSGAGAADPRAYAGPAPMGPGDADRRAVSAYGSYFRSSGDSIAGAVPRRVRALAEDGTFGSTAAPGDVYAPRDRGGNDPVSVEPTAGNGEQTSWPGSSWSAPQRPGTARSGAAPEANMVPPMRLGWPPPFVGEFSTRHGPYPAPRRGGTAGRSGTFPRPGWSAIRPLDGQPLRRGSTTPPRPIRERDLFSAVSLVDLAGGLDLNAAQRQAIGGIQDALARQRREIVGEIMDIEAELRRLRAVQARQVQLIVNLRGRFGAARDQAEHGVRELLTGSQRQELEDLHRQLLGSGVGSAGY